MTRSVSQYYSDNTNGRVVTPLVGYKYERLPTDITLNFSCCWALGKSDSGWVQTELFLELLANFFYSWFNGINITFPVILFIDGHVSHFNQKTNQFCD